MTTRPFPSPGVARSAGWLVAAGSALALFTACAGGGPEPVPAAPSRAASTQSGASSNPSAPITSTGDPMTSNGTGAQTTISGVMIEGLRANCRILQTDQRRYALTGAGTADLRVGEQVTVTGQPRPDLISPCGSVFVVSALG